ncbi:3-phosphoserine/phosphohydroxythreonine transaminase [Flavilitoribacter nigricans]|uniref:Phosphoserine aminotransferase n=1 Tax=Flavilitoribacter nigricans (strain ATCC 23147 / DSM 23189 / NBRC 102662 / NCIMB 1420 / SS-2) TaxID=1122177 RepID=A0A2D0MXN2_FLAN2|nr:3-phosphoserine/phosphohydroxythreonine transaminase [Flavilitoribacter nigricans]PHN00886.1 3-phosphoserine/phosphohydroxythreonine aminotransferase [Flavilitoribacter nigricans DSM 23189 = NBRC 102662]
MKKYNFSAGPAILPAEVMKEAGAACVNFNNSGFSILEISHRSADFSAVLAEAEALVREIGGIGEEFAVLFLSGGASSQFFMAPMNLLDDSGKAVYVDTGSWAAKAVKESKAFGPTEVLASSKADNYTHIPKGYTIPADATYLHLTSNNTIFGTQLAEYPETDVPLVVDMSSDMFSRPFPVDRFGIIYAGAQKNLGPAGVTLVIVRKDLLGKVDRHIPTMLNYNTHIEKGSTFNTPPVFPIYVMMLTLRWVKAQGGLEAVAKNNEEKAAVLYKEIDENPMFAGTVTQKEDRSLMNVTFVMADEYKELEGQFLEACKAAGCMSVKGHRSVGGFRASIYNAMPKEGIETLVKVMQDFRAAHA